MKRYIAHIVKATPEAKQFVLDYLDTLTAEQRTAALEKIEDSIEICPQLGEKAIFINPDQTGNKVKQLIQLCDVIQFGKTFLKDTGTGVIPITKDNYKSIPYLQWLNESPYQE
jgi:hypothetical protein